MSSESKSIDNNEKILIKEKLGFALGDTASNLVWQTLMIFQMYFYTDVFGIPAAVVGTMFLITKIWDSINDNGSSLRSHKYQVG